MNPLSIRANYGKNFWKGKIGFIGTLEFSEAGCHFIGKSRTFMMKSQDCDVSYPIGQIKEIVFKRNALYLYLVDGKKVPFITVFSYTAAGTTDVKSGSYLPGIVGDVAEVRYAADQENAQLELYTALRSTAPWSPLIPGEITGISLKNLYKLQLVAQFAPIIISAGMVAYYLIFRL